MKYLIVSDIHGSLPALEQVLAFYSLWNPIRIRQTT